MDFWKKGDSAQRGFSGDVAGPEGGSVRPKTARDSADIMGLLGPSVRIKGDLFFDCTLRIDGTLEGDVVSPDELFIGKTGCVKGDVTVRRINISGRLDGQLYALENAEIENGAQVNGLIVARMLQVREGAQIQARMLMGEYARRILAERAALPDIAGPTPQAAPEQPKPGEAGAPAGAAAPPAEPVTGSLRDEAGEGEPGPVPQDQPGAEPSALPLLSDAEPAEEKTPTAEPMSYPGRKRHKRG